MANLPLDIPQGGAQTRIETYIPLYRKYRPQRFADVVGQEAIVQTLGNAIQLNKVAHAYLFCGPRGTGKTSTARIFAKSLNCEQGPTVDPCLQCATCTGIAEGNALDVIEFDAASNNKVDDARELIENCQYSSMSGRFKVYIIDEVHMLTTQAFNALLKTLEEPPPNVIFIFATTEAHKVLPTIVSRCQRFDFNRITTENIVSRLQHIAEVEQIRINDEALHMIARHARGGMRDAVGLLDQVAVLGRAEAGKVIDRKDVALFIGTLEEDILLKLGAAIAERRAADLLNELGELLNRGIEPIQLLKDLTLHFRNLLLVQAAGPAASADKLSLPADYFAALGQQAGLFSEPEELPQIIGRLSFIERNIRNSQQPQLWLEVGLIELAYRYDIQVVKELAERVAKLEAQLAGGIPTLPATAPAAISQPMPAPQPRPAAMPETGMVSPMAPATPGSATPPRPAAPPGGSLDADYARIVATIPGATKSLAQQQTFPISLNDDLLTIGCPSEAILNTLKGEKKFIHLQKAVDKFYGRPMRIQLVLEKNRPHPSVAATSPAMAPLPAPASPQTDLPPQPAIPAAADEPAGMPSLPSHLAALMDALPQGPEEAEAPGPVDLPPADMPEEDEEAALAQAYQALPPETDAPPTPAPMPVALPDGPGPDLDESKKFAREILQGQMLE